MKTKVIFLGATQNVTGSRFLLETQGLRILIDCGLYQEREFQERNWARFPIEPETIQCVILTHSHLDHCGYLPKLVREGFKGEIYCTEPTAQIAEIALLDSAKLSEESAEFKKKRHTRENRRGPFPEIPLYTVEEARNVFKHFVTYGYNEPIKITSNGSYKNTKSEIIATFFDAGHILGSAIIEFKIRNRNEEKTLIFTGDLGRWNRPLICDPTTFESADYVVIESTYGDRVHDEQEKCEQVLKETINSTKKLGGNVVIPTFAVERAQELLYYFNKFIRAKEIPPLMVFVDSPMAVDVTEVFKNNVDYFDEETKLLIKNNKSPFDFALFKLVRTKAESKAMNSIKGSAIIMAGSGMCTGGRIKHHLVNNIERKESTILFVSYQATGTLGREILNKPEEVRILGSIYKVNAQIRQVEGFSAHADKNELLRWILSFKKYPKKVFIVHGEKETAYNFQQTLSHQIPSTIITPHYAQEFELE